MRWRIVGRDPAGSGEIRCSDGSVALVDRRARSCRIWPESQVGPVGAENSSTSSDEAIFMEESADAICARDP